VPTWETTARFEKDIRALGSDQLGRFRTCIAEKFVAGLSDPPFLPGLRVKGVQGYPGVFEMTWAPDGRATFEYGEEIEPAEPHIVWRRVGTHDIFYAP